MKDEYDPTSLWRDIVVGDDRTLVGFQRRLNVSVGLDQDHRWLFGTDRDHRDSDVTDEGRSPFGPSPGRSLGGGKPDDPAETTIAQLARRSNLDERDRICYPFDYGDERRCDGILREIEENGPADREPEVVKSKGDPSNSTRHPTKRGNRGSARFRGG